MTQKEYDSGVNPLGDPLKKQAPPDDARAWTNTLTGEVLNIPKGIDPGFGYNVGKAAARAKELQQLVETKLAGAPEELAQAAVEAGLKLPVFEAQATAKAAAQWAMDRGLVDYADYGKIHPDIANDWNRGLFDSLQEFPELRINQKFTGSAQAQNSRYYDINLARVLTYFKTQGADDDLAERWAQKMVKKPKVPGKRWAQSWMQEDVSGVVMNEKWGKIPAELQRSLSQGVATQWHPVGCDTVKSIFDHEIGHQLDGLLGLSQDAEILRVYTELRNQTGVKDALSEYANKNIAEFISEAWAEYRNNPTPRAVAARIGGIVETRYRSRFPA